MVRYPGEHERAWGGRLPLADPATFDDEQRSLDGELRAAVVPWADRAGFASTTDSGRFIGPMNIYLHRPRLSRAYLDFILTEQRESSLPAAVREVVILAVGVAWRADFVVDSHVVLARAAGLSRSTIEAVLRGGTGDEGSRDVRVAHRFAIELVDHRTVSDETYGEVVEIFGEAGAIDMASLVGIYLTASALQNAFEVPGPDRSPAE